MKEFMKEMRHEFRMCRSLPVLLPDMLCQLFHVEWLLSFGVSKSVAQFLLAISHVHRTNAWIKECVWPPAWDICIDLVRFSTRAGVVRRALKALYTMCRTDPGAFRRSVASGRREDLEKALGRITNLVIEAAPGVPAGLPDECDGQATYILHSMEESWDFPLMAWNSIPEPTEEDQYDQRIRTIAMSLICPDRRSEHSLANIQPP
jgi:hypothetical protein